MGLWAKRLLTYRNELISRTVSSCLTQAVYVKLFKTAEPFCSFQCSAVKFVYQNGEPALK